jgi:dTDP-4-dehydrorhamnose reductase
MKVLLTGAAGQLGQALLASRPEGVQLISCTRAELDLANSEACRAAVASHRPDWLLNAGAYTAVDRAESESELAQAVNAGAPAAFAEALAQTGGRMLQISTDFVFDGRQGSPYLPDQGLSPLGVYGATKASGERAVLEALPLGRRTVLRTSWVYGPGGQNFLLTMLRLHRLKAAAGEPLGVVADQVGCPTSTAGLAQACWRLIERFGKPVLAGDSELAVEPDLLPSVWHWSDAGAASWYDFAVAIGELAVAAGLLEQAAQVRPITTAGYPTPAQRPGYSLLDCTTTRELLEMPPIHWRQALGQVIDQLKKA